MAFAVGVFFGFSPMLGLHTVLGLAVAFFHLTRMAKALTAAGKKPASPDGTAGVGS